MTEQKAREAQKFIGYLIMDQLEQIAAWELKENLFYIKYFSDWKYELEELFKLNSIYIKQGRYDLVKYPERR